MIVSLTENRFHNWLKSSGNYSVLHELGTNSGLADGVDVTGEVEHLVGEAPQIILIMICEVAWDDQL